MGIGYKEAMILLVVLAVIVIVVVVMLRSAGKSSRVSMRSATERLAELESLRKANQITAAEYERQRAAIISSV
jgi:uncharacterized membrane protein